MAQESAQDVQTLQEERYKMEMLKVINVELLNLAKKVNEIYERLAFVKIVVGKKVEEEGWWDIYEKLEGVEKDIKDSLVALNALLHELNIPYDFTPEVVESKSELDEIYEIFNELAEIYNKKIVFLLVYTEEGKFHNIYGRIEYYIRPALWSALLGLVDVLYAFASR